MTFCPFWKKQSRHGPHQAFDGTEVPPNLSIFGEETFKMVSIKNLIEEDPYYANLI